MPYFFASLKRNRMSCDNGCMKSILERDTLLAMTHIFPVSRKVKKVGERKFQSMFFLITLVSLRCFFQFNLIFKSVSVRFLKERKQLGVFLFCYFW